ncbi:MAG: NAD/NADP octopine/nopaline dehydrogenase family protein [Desulfobacteraceae bacterium]
MTVKEIAVIGGGNGALTTAGDMALAGFNVRMWTVFPEEYGDLYETHTLKLRGLGRTGEARKTDSSIEKLKQLYPAIHPVENAFSVALLNVGPIIHSCLVLLNTGPIEHFESWDIHNEGTTASVKKLILAHDRERIALREALGFTCHHYPFSDHYDQESEEPWMYGRKAHTDLVKSESWREPLHFGHRYITEDVKCNLALLTSIGDFAGQETPIADSLLTLLGVIVGEDFRKTGRTLETLGLGQTEKEEMERILLQGL